MPEQKTLERAREDEREGKSPSTQAGEFVREEMEHIRDGKHGAASAKQAIAIGLSKARRAGVKLPPPKHGSRKTKRQARRELKSAKRHRKPSRRRSRAAKRRLKREPRRAASHRALSRQAHKAARRRSASSRSRSAKKAARTREKKAPLGSAHGNAQTKASRAAKHQEGCARGKTETHHRAPPEENAPRARKAGGQSREEKTSLNGPS